MRVSGIVAALLAVVAVAAWLGRPAPAGAAPSRIVVPKAIIHVDDGDTVRLDWPDKDPEEIRILGIDTPEVLHLEHDLPFPQPFGEAAGGFLRGCLAASNRVELLRSGTKDRYGRTLGYLFVNGMNYSPLVIRARLAYGPNPRYGDNGLPAPYKACVEAAEAAGTPPFEPPWQFRKRMREVSKRMKAEGTYPRGPGGEVAPAPPEGDDGRK